MTDALNLITDSVNRDLSKALTFYEWRDKGGYHVTGSTSQEFLVSCASNEFGNMIAREVSTLLDQALEHRLLMSDAHRNGKTASSSWLLVTGYYWCVFLALAWLRLVGKVVTYLPTPEIERLQQMCSGAYSKTPRTGTFVISVSDVDGARSNIKYRRLNTNNFHEGLWDTFYKDIDYRLNVVKKERANTETSLFGTLNFRSRIDRTGWLSKLRNVVNYRVGSAYGAVNGSQVPNLMPGINLAKLDTVDVLVRNLERMQGKTYGRAVEKHLDEYGNVLILFGSLLNHLLDDYSTEIWTTRCIDPEWSERRGQYVAQFGQALPELWPM